MSAKNKPVNPHVSSQSIITSHVIREEKVMSATKITRRSFLAGTAGVAALAGCSVWTSSNAWSSAYAEDETEPAVPPKQIHTVCDGCPNQCGMVAYTVEGELWRVTGEAGHPHSGGYLCGRGQGYAGIAYSEDRLTQPLKKNDAGTFDPIDWNTALGEIAAKFTAAKPEEVAVFQARSSCKPFAKRFVDALGSANYFTDAAIHDADITAAVNALAGTTLPLPDPAHAKYIVMLDKSTNDTVLPADAEAFAELHDNGGQMVLVDSRITPFAREADEWVPILPGTELAFLLGVAGQLIRTNAYNAAFVAEYGEGFDQFATEMKTYTLEWASEKTGISSDKLGAIANSLATAAPACYVDMPTGGTFGAAYGNSADTVRMVYLVNALLGNFNQKGGWIFGKLPLVDDVALEGQGIASVPAGTAAALAADVAPLTGGDSCVAAVQAINEGTIKDAIVVETNPVRDYPAAAFVTQALDKLDCLVVCDCFMTETAELADYILPLDTYMEHANTVEMVPALTSVAALRNPVIERVYPETKSVDEVFTALANACGLGDTFNFTLEDYNRAACAAMGVSYDGLVKQGVSTIPNTAISWGDVPTFATESGKLLFSCQAFADAGLSAVPSWSEPSVKASEALPRLLVGEEATQYDTYTIDDDQLMAYAKKYELDKAWINADLAANFGIANGDTVEIQTSEGSLEAPVKVTQQIMPEAVWMPVHFGCTAKQVKQAYGFGVAPKQLIGMSVEVGTGAAMMNDVTVAIRKVGA